MLLLLLCWCRHKVLLLFFWCIVSVSREQLNTVLTYYTVCATVQFYIVCMHYNFLLLHFSVTQS